MIQLCQRARLLLHISNRLPILRLQMRRARTQHTILIPSAQLHRETLLQHLRALQIRIPRHIGDTKATLPQHLQNPEIADIRLWR